MKRVVITGIAPIAAMGSGEAFFENLYAMKPVIIKADESFCNGTNTSEWYVPYPEVDITPYRKRLKRIPGLAPKNAQTAAISALMAADDAGISEFDPDTAVFYGISTINLEDSLIAYNAAVEDKAVHPLANPKSMANAVPAWISIMFGIHGRTIAVATACASGTDAIGAAYEYIAAGKGRMVICGAADYMKCPAELTFRSFDVLSALTHTTDGLPRPFSEERSGFLFSHGGACTLILEEYESAAARGAEIYAEITNYSAGCDAFHIVKMPDYPEQVIRMLKEMSAGKQVDYYNAHGTATVVNDKMEADALKAVFGDSLRDIPVNATKSMTGHVIGTSGALEAAVTAYSIRHGKIHGNLIGTPMEGLNLPQQTVEKEIRCAITASFGFGGHNSALMLEKI